MSMILQKELLSAGRERQLTEMLETSPLDWHFAGLFFLSPQNISDLPRSISVVISVRETKRIQGRSISTFLSAYFPGNTTVPTLISASGFGRRFAHFYE
jgi:hypothetical protein